MATVVPRIATAMNSSTDPRVLQTLGMQGVSLALWERRLTDRLSRSLDALRLDRLPRMHRRLAVQHVAGAVGAACSEAGAGDCAKQLAADTEELAAHAVQVFSSLLLDIRFDVAEEQPYPTWHMSSLSGRMICTLSGPGIEYGPVGPRGRPQSIHRMARGAVGAFRGIFWPGQEIAGIVHRSPQRTAGERRLLVIIDPVDDAGAC